MKIFKKKEHALLVKTYAVRNQTYFAPSVLIFFDLTAPETPLTEQDLWKTVPDQLGPGAALDQGMPKQRAEVLAIGDCYAPRGETVRASEVRVAVGGLSKTLHVFGDRHWRSGEAISDPAPFARMPLGWDKAYGGPDYEKNPLGKGRAPVLVNGKSLVPLPNLEYPRQLIGAPRDTPEPAWFGQLDMGWPQRKHKTGTYDEAWLHERWPHFPDDMDYTFFNEASEDQQQDKFFSGDEQILILNMHPDIPAIASRLPGLRIRCFTTLRTNFKPFADPNSYEETFAEVGMHVDTVWLFPSILRGVAVYRGAIASRDEEYGDIARVFVASEQLSEPPKSIDHYLEEQKKALDRRVPINMAPLQAAQKQISKAMLKLKNVPKIIEGVKQAVRGQVPVMSRSASEMAAMGGDLAANSLGVVDKLEQMAQQFHAQWGHMVKIDLGVFATVREKINSMTARTHKAAQALETQIEQALQKKAEVLKDQAAFIRQQLSPKQMQALDIDPDDLLKEKSQHPWQDQALAFAVACRKNLERHSYTNMELKKMGFEPATIRRGWLGVNVEEQVFKSSDWGFKGEPGSPDSEIVIPRGLVLPAFDGAKPIRIRVQPGVDRPDIRQRDQVIDVRGSDATSLYLPAAEADAPVVRLGGELQARYVEQEVGDVVDAVSMRLPSDPLSKDATACIGKAEIFLIVMPEGTTATSKDWLPWPKKFPNARLLPLPKGKTVFDSREAGVDIRQFILDALPPELAARHELAPALPEDGKPPAAIKPLPFPKLDIGALVKEMMQEVKDREMPAFDAARAEAKAMTADMTQHWAKKGIDVEKAMAAATRPESSTHSAEKMVQALEKERATQKRLNILTPDTDKKITDSIEQIRGLAKNADARRAASATKLEAMQQQAAAMKAQLATRELPGAAGESMRAAGITADAIRPLTREEVIERHAAGLNFYRKNLTGLDLSKLDLTGIDLRQAILAKAKFCDSILDKADLTKAIGQIADFSGASLAGANLESCVLQGAKFTKANLQGAKLHMALLGRADLTKANLSGADLRMAALERATLTGAVFAAATMNLSVVAESDMKDADFTGATMHKVMFRNLALDNATFAGATLKQTLLWGVHGAKVSFEGANLDQVRIGSGTALPAANFHGATLREAALRDSDLSGASFKGSVLDKALIDGCDLSQADLFMVSAKRARIQKSNLEAADMRGMNLFMGSLRKSRLVKADLEASNLYAVDFYKSTVGETKFDKANLKRTLLHKKTDLLK